MFEDEGPDAFLGEQKAQDRSSASGTDHNDVNLYVHTRQDEWSERTARKRSAGQTAYSNIF